MLLPESSTLPGPWPEPFFDLASAQALTHQGSYLTRDGFLIIEATAMTALHF